MPAPTSLCSIPVRSRLPIHLTIFARTATGARTCLSPPSTSPATFPAIRISTTQVYGGKTPNTAGYGRRRPCPLVGRHTATATGPGLPLGDGPGWTTRLGATRHFTTEDGFSSEEVGRGFRDRLLLGRSTRPPWWHGSVGAASVWESPSVVDPPSVGSPWGLAKSGCPPTITAPLILNASTSRTP